MRGREGDMLVFAAYFLFVGGGWIMMMERGKGEKGWVGLQEVVDGVVDVVVHVVVGPAGSIVELVGVVGSTT